MKNKGDTHIGVLGQRFLCLGIFLLSLSANFLHGISPHSQAEHDIR